MAEHRRRVEPVQVNYLCDECSNPVEQSGTTLMCYPPLYLHRCKQCGREYQFRKQYPYIEWRPLE